MSDIKTISEIYEEHERSFLKHLKQARKLEEKKVHKLRVEIKNLRVLFEFLKVFSGKKFKTRPLLKLLSPVFKRAGKIRTLHLNQVLTHSERSAVMLRFKEYLQKEEKKAGERLIREIRNFDRKKLMKLHEKNIKTFRKLDSLALREESENYVRSIFAKIRTDMFDMNQDSVLHEIRKNLKTIKNVGQLLSEIDAAQSLNADIQKMYSSYDKIGKWHDGVVLAEKFENYVRKKEKPEVQKKALELVLKLKEKNEKNKILIARKLREDLV
jgi:CHAD domain-containing protein